MSCYEKKNLTSAEKSAKRFREYVNCVSLGILACIISLVLSSIVVAKRKNGAMILHLVLSIITGVTLAVLTYRAIHKFKTVEQQTSVPKITYSILVLIGVLWVSSLVTLFSDSPVDLHGQTFDKRGFGSRAGIDKGVGKGPVIGCLIMDFTFILGAIESVLQLIFAIHYARKAEEESASTAEA